VSTLVRRLPTPEPPAVAAPAAGSGVPGPRVR